MPEAFDAEVAELNEIYNNQRDIIMGMSTKMSLHYRKFFQFGRKIGTIFKFL